MSPSSTLSRLCTLTLVTATLAACAGAPRGGEQARELRQNLHAFSMATNLGEIEEGRLAVAQSTAAPVRQFAQRMIDDHSTALSQEHRLMMEHDVGLHAGHAMPAPAGGVISAEALRPMLLQNPWSRPLVENHERAMQMMRTTRGAAFDRMYMQRQVELHRYALGVLDRNMETARNVMPSDAVEFLTRERAMIQNHLQQAQQILQGM